MRKQMSIIGIALPVWLAFSTAPAWSDTRIEKNLALLPGGRLVVDVEGGSVDVRGTSESGAKVLITSSRDDIKDLYDFGFEETQGMVRVTAKKKSGLYSFLSSLRGTSLRIDVQVPELTSLTLDTSGGGIKIAGTRGVAKAETSGGSIDVSALTGNLAAETSGGSISLAEIHGDAKAETSGGSIHVAALEGSLDAHTSGGGIDLKRVTGEIEASTSGGSVSIEEAGGRVHAETAGGAMEVGFAKGNSGGGEVKCSGGSIRVAIDPSVSLTVDASASGGSVSSDIPVTGSDDRSRTVLRGSIGKGGQTLILRTSGGSIRIHPI